MFKKTFISPTERADATRAGVLTLAEAKCRAVLAAMIYSDGNLRQAARLLQCSRSTLYRLISAYEITFPGGTT